MENIITYKTTNLFSTPDLVSLFTSVGWVNESAEYPNRLENAMYHSDIVFSAWDGDKLVGLLSTISDTMHVYITYLLVDPSYQNRKIDSEEDAYFIILAVADIVTGISTLGGFNHE